MGRPARVLSEAEKAEVETLAAVLSTEQIADYLGMGRRTFYSLMQGDDDLAARYKRGRAKAIGAIAQSLIDKARSGNTTAMIFFLKTQAGWRETIAVEQVPETEVTTLDMSLLSTATLRELGAAFGSPEEPRRPVKSGHLIEAHPVRPVTRSGTTLIVAETTGCTCHAIELDPACVDAAVLRSQASTGQDAGHAEPGSSFAELTQARNSE